MINTALVGLTGYAALYVERLLHYQKTERINWKALVIRNKEESETQKVQIEYLKAQGVKVFESLAALFDQFEKGTLDLICLPTSIDSHKVYTEQALNYGCHVLVEKPAAAKLEDIESMCAVRDQANRKVFVGFQHIYAKDIEAIKAALNKNVLGAIRNIKVVGYWPRSMTYYTRNEWAGKLKSNGNWVLDSPINNAFSHHINLSMYLAGGKIDSVNGALYRAMPIETFDTASVRIEMNNGISIAVQVSHACEINLDPEISIDCELGTVYWSDKKYSIVKNGQIVLSDEGRDVSQSRIEQFEAVVSNLEGNDTQICSLEQAMELTRLVNILHDTLEVKEVDSSQIAKFDTPHGLQYSIKNIEMLLNS